MGRNKIGLKTKGRKSFGHIPLNFGYHLVFSEGTETEPNYVNNIKERIAKNFLCRPGEIDIHPHNEDGSKSTLSLLEYAESKTNDIIKQGIRVDHVWIFYDKDDFKKDSFDNTYFAIVSKNSYKENDDGDMADKNGTVWHACWSNECFELWILLHFQNVTSGIARKDFIKKINKYIHDTKYGIYDKNNKHNFDLIELNGGSMEKAIEYAENLDKMWLTSKPNPSTGVYLFAKHFKRYIERK